MSSQREDPWELGQLAAYSVVAAPDSIGDDSLCWTLGLSDEGDFAARYGAQALRVLEEQEAGEPLGYAFLGDQKVVELVGSGAIVSVLGEPDDSGGLTVRRWRKLWSFERRELERRVEIFIAGGSRFFAVRALRTDRVLDGPTLRRAIVRAVDSWSTLTDEGRLARAGFTNFNVEALMRVLGDPMLDRYLNEGGVLGLEVVPLTPASYWRVMSDLAPVVPEVVVEDESGPGLDMELEEDEEWDDSDEDDDEEELDDDDGVDDDEEFLEDEGEEWEDPDEDDDDLEDDDEEELDEED